LEYEAVIRRALAEHSVQTVFHLGGQTLVGVAKTDPVGTLEANVRGTWLLLEAARQTRVHQILIASSIKAYGDASQPCREDHPVQGRSPYDVSKSCTDLIAAMYAHSFGVPTGIVRCGNLFGGGDQNFSRLIPGVILATLNNESFCFRSDGSFICDFLYVEDAADAYMWLAERMAADPSLHGEAFNFGLQLRYSMLEVTEKVLSLMGRSDLRPLVQKGVTENSNEQTLDITKARERLRWRPKYGMEQGLKLTIEWYTRFATSASRETVACNTAVA
jgi:CDP-glucose 4,6-dehydratase